MGRTTVVGVRNALAAASLCVLAAILWGRTLEAQVVVLATNASGAHSEDGCNNCSSICGVGYHLDECGVSGAYQWSGINCYNYCHQGVSCTGSHTQGCNQTLAPGQVRAVLAAAESGDIEVLAKYLEISSQVDLNDQRRAIQIGGCSGLVIASVTLSATAYDALNQRLATTGVGTARGGSWPVALIAADRALW